MCGICGYTYCHPKCPNYVQEKCPYYCSICNQEIQTGEEYIENELGEISHWECVDYGRNLAKFLGYEIKTMEE